MANEKHALVLGASGISGWAVVNQCRNYPSSSTFKRITGTTNRPLTLEEARIPSDDRIKLVNGVDFTKSVDEVVELLKKNIPDVDTVTHVFFLAYIHKDTFEDLRKVNVALLENAIGAIDKVAPKLESVILQTGGKYYGVEFTDKITLSTPLRDDAPRIKEPEASNIFYYPQYDSLQALAKGKSWTFTEIRPDVILGFVPNDNAMDAARGVAFYLSLYRHINGAGAKIPFPGTQGSWTNKHSDTLQDILAQGEIHVALNPERCGNGKAFNIANGDVTTWSAKWPALCSHFGLEAEGPKEGTQSIGDFIKEHGDKWSDIVSQNGLRSGIFEKYSWPFLEFVMVVFDFDREYDISSSRNAGFKEAIDTPKAWTLAIERLQAAKIIPQ